MHIRKVKIKIFRAFKDLEVNLGENVTAILGQNGTMKSTLLGMIGESFRFSKTSGQTIFNKNFEIKFNDAFKFSDGIDGFDKAGEHIWTIYLKGAFSTKEFTTKSIYRNKNNKTIRLWNSKGKNKGDKHIQFPVIFLSLSRLAPIGEIKKLSINDASNVLDCDEVEFLKNSRNNILHLQESNNSTQLIQNSNKSTIGFSTGIYDSKTMPSGQDNTGRIISSIISFRRLKEKLGDEYKGGIFLIDEIDATMYPAAQKSLIKFLIHHAKDLKLQIIFTTHSLDSISPLFEKEFKNVCKILYLEKKSDEVKVHEDLSLTVIQDNLLLSKSTNVGTPKINVWSEDEITRFFAKGILSTNVKKIKF